MKHFFSSLRKDQVPTHDSIEEAIDKLATLKSNLEDLRAASYVINNNPNNRKAKEKFDALIVSIIGILHREEVLVQSIKEEGGYQPLDKKHQFEPKIKLVIMVIADKTLLILDSWLTNRYPERLNKESLIRDRGQLEDFYSALDEIYWRIYSTLSDILLDENYYLGTGVRPSFFINDWKGIVKSELEDIFLFGERFDELKKGYDTYHKFFSLEQGDYKRISNNEFDPRGMLIEMIELSLKSRIWKKI